MGQRIIQTEADVKRACKVFLDSLGIWSFHILQGMGSYPGVPDRFAIHQGRVYALEMKHPSTGRLSRKQKDFRKLWQDRYGDTFVEVRSVDDLIRGLGLQGKLLF